MAGEAASPAPPIIASQASIVMRRQHSNEASSASDFGLSLPESDQVVGKLKGLFDAYVQKYYDEEARFAEASAGMDSVINATADTEARLRAVEEKARMRAESEKRLNGITGFIRTLDGAVQAMRAGGSWLDKFPDLKAKVERIYQANPVLLAKSSIVSSIKHRWTGLKTADDMATQAQQLAEQAKAYLAYLRASAPVSRV
eukprot:CAMPEP_0171178668 /NCGR_PEP_ID=MMETSP0790-20130122/12866_1 /TAXON_ID=2925 /ORGANISM="Alexandrium catenella, Strain OF101" /LENGTH=199 /DNA_ID=CAMNT_0011643589 /DNA_START=70 /DNA_END=670 /DNA_ORIENTATION=+